MTVHFISELFNQFKICVCSSYKQRKALCFLIARQNKFTTPLKAFTVFHKPVEWM